ncbi:unnamed protein product [Calypogeia fissa]
MVEEMTTNYMVKHRKTTPYHPKANGLTERANGIIGKILNKMVAAHKSDWDYELFSAVYFYNLSHKTTTGQSPYFLVHGQHPLVPVEFELPTIRTLVEERMGESQGLEERTYQLEHLEEERDQAARRLAYEQCKAKRYFDKHLKPKFLKEGDLVLMYDSRYAYFPGKLHTRWLGPYKVNKVFDNGSTMEVATLEGEVYPVRVNHDRLKQYFEQEE